MVTEAEIREKEQLLAAKEAELDEKEKKLSKFDQAVGNAKDNLYSKIDVSLKTMDHVVIGVSATLAVVLAIAVLL